MEEKFKQLLCKNDDCLRFLAEIRKIEFKPGLILRIKCHKCGTMNIWRFGYSEVEEQFDTIKELIGEGGEQ